MLAETDPLLRRIERSSLIVAAVLAALGAIAAHEAWKGAASVIAGGVLSAISYLGIKAGVDAISTGEHRPKRARAIALVKFFTRYALLGFAAYVMISRFRLPPLGVLAGASSVVIAVAIEAFRRVGRSGPGSTF